MTTFDVVFAKRAFWTATCVLLMGLSSCKADEIVCAGVTTPGIRLQVRDAVTSADLSAMAVVSVRRTIGVADSLVGSPSFAVKLADDVPNTYQIRVSAPGYVTATRNVVVPPSPERCGSVVTQDVRIDLTRQP